MLCLQGNFPENCFKSWFMERTESWFCSLKRLQHLNATLDSNKKILFFLYCFCPYLTPSYFLKTGEPCRCTRGFDKENVGLSVTLQSSAKTLDGTPHGRLTEGALQQGTKWLPEEKQGKEGIFKGWDRNKAAWIARAVEHEGDGGMFWRQKQEEESQSQILS